MTHLQTRAKWSEQNFNLMENQLVLLKDPNTKPLDWPMGRILEVFPGRDGLVRVVNVKTSTVVLCDVFSPNRVQVPVCSLRFSPDFNTESVWYSVITQENTIERRTGYGGARRFLWGGITLGSRTDLHRSECNGDRPHLSGMTFWNNMYVCFGRQRVHEFLCMDDNARHSSMQALHCNQTNAFNRRISPRYGLARHTSPDLNPTSMCGICLAERLQPVNPPDMSTGTSAGALLDEVVLIFPKIRLII
ncbi:integrase catalytic domain-containing protein [Trichonephila clavipes]|nr:integrase catalytic domain-containing protein [Trichonephila clavipes]